MLTSKQLTVIAQSARAARLHPYSLQSTTVMPYLYTTTLVLSASVWLML